MTGKPTLIAVEPQVFVSDMAAALAFYTDKLGFSVQYAWGDPPYYSQVVRDRARLNLRCLDRPAIDPALRDAKELLSATVIVDDVAALSDEFERAGAVFCQTLATKPWGARDFIIADQDGNLILFAGR